MPLGRMSKMAIIQAHEIPNLSLLYKLGKLPAATPVEYSTLRIPPTILGPRSIPAPSKSLNDRVGLIRGDITELAVDAIVNAAKNSLLGGGGVDGAIHQAAGNGLYLECKALNGCKTGSAKITGAYRLPCKRVIHAVGPIYSHNDPKQSENELVGCYTKSLELAVAHGCRTVAFSAISTGIYGYPSRLAAPAALSAIRKFLEEDKEHKIDKAVIVTFVKNDVDAYNDTLPFFFPPVIEAKSDSSPADKPAAEETTAKDTGKKGEDGVKQTEEEAKQTEEAKLDAEAEAIAKELPSPPTADPSATDDGHAAKKQKVSGNDT